MHLLDIIEREGYSANRFIHTQKDLLVHPAKPGGRNSRSVSGPDGRHNTHPQAIGVEADKLQQLIGDNCHQAHVRWVED
ncbi:MAG: hypothetical protein KME20_10005 [Kaiparowitsia implicata GSE-PSE-MK54-09C]|jgi:hypothetical protein|nr:hypothetical protein [Kaiparowitsia implicata GSE-PSE-MK54-09C]